MMLIVLSVIIDQTSWKRFPLDDNLNSLCPVVNEGFAKSHSWRYTVEEEVSDNTTLLTRVIQNSLRGPCDIVEIQLDYPVLAEVFLRKLGMATLVTSFL
jgi:hypothetical protein